MNGSFERNQIRKEASTSVEKKLMTMVQTKSDHHFVTTGSHDDDDHHHQNRPEGKNKSNPDDDYSTGIHSNFGFPFKPYPIQMDLMKRMIQALTEGKIAILESPTGTGKSLSILCSSLFWLNNYHEREKYNLQQEIKKCDDELLCLDSDKSCSDWVQNHHRKKGILDQKNRLNQLMQVILWKEKRNSELRDRRLKIHSLNHPGDHKKKKFRLGSAAGIPEKLVTTGAKRHLDHLDSNDGVDPDSILNPVEDHLMKDEEMIINYDSGGEKSAAADDDQDEDDDGAYGLLREAFTETGIGVSSRKFWGKKSKGSLGGSSDAENCNSSSTSHPFDDPFNPEIRLLSEVKPKVFYASRTHSQLSQFISEIKKSKYSSCSLRIISLGSRSNLCINPNVNRNMKSRAADKSSCQSTNVSVINDKCLEMMKKSKKDEKCSFLSSKQKLIELKDGILAQIQDIEDLVHVGKEMSSCPFYASRLAISEADVVILPYNILLHEKTRKSYGISSLKDSIIIIDEAHNLLETIASVHSCEVSLDQFSGCFNQLSSYLSRYRCRLNPKNLMYIKQLLNFLKCIIIFLKNPQHFNHPHQNSSTPIDKQKVQLSQSSHDYHHPEQKMFRVVDFMLSVGIDNLNLFKLLNFCEKTQISRKLFGFSTTIDHLMHNRHPNNNDNYNDDIKRSNRSRVDHAASCQSVMRKSPGVTSAASVEDSKGCDEQNKIILSSSLKSGSAASLKNSVTAKQTNNDNSTSSCMPLNKKMKVSTADGNNRSSNSSQELEENKSNKRGASAINRSSNHHFDGNRLYHNTPPDVSSDHLLASGGSKRRTTVGFREETVATDSNKTRKENNKIDPHDDQKMGRNFNKNFGGEVPSDERNRHHDVDQHHHHHHHDDWSKKNWSQSGQEDSSLNSSILVRKNQQQQMIGKKEELNSQKVGSNTDTSRIGMTQTTNMISQNDDGSQKLGVDDDDDHCSNRSRHITTHHAANHEMMNKINSSPHHVTKATLDTNNSHTPHNDNSQAGVKCSHDHHHNSHGNYSTAGSSSSGTSKSTGTSAFLARIKSVKIQQQLKKENSQNTKGLKHESSSSAASGVKGVQQNAIINAAKNSKSIQHKNTSDGNDGRETIRKKLDTGFINKSQKDERVNKKFKIDQEGQPASSSFESRPTSPLYSIIELIKCLTHATSDGRILITTTTTTSSSSFSSHHLSGHSSSSVSLQTSVRHDEASSSSSSHQNTTGGSHEMTSASIRYILLNPCESFKGIVEECKSLVLAGGTMKPFEELTEFLFKPMGVRSDRIMTFSCGHMIPDANILPLAISTGPSERIKLNFSFQMRNDQKMIEESGKAIVTLSQVVEGGIVLFFSSYDYLERVYLSWKKFGILDQIRSTKEIFKEPKRASDLNQLLSEYAKAVNLKSNHPVDTNQKYTGPKSQSLKSSGAAAATSYPHVTPDISSNHHSRPDFSCLTSAAAAPSSLKSASASGLNNTKSSSGAHQKSYTTGGGAPKQHYNNSTTGVSDATAKGTQNKSSNSGMRKGGAILFSVVGGKMSEGINFNDNMCRCVIIMGLPYPNIKSPVLQEKMSFLEKEQGSGSGKVYYENLCFKAINQSIGRSIRHSNDYSVILLMDQRFSGRKDHIRSSLPKWISDHLKTDLPFNTCIKMISQFFHDKKSHDS